MPPMREASPENAEEEEAIGTAVPEPSFGWLPDPAAQIRSSVSGAAVPVATAPPAPRVESDGAAEHDSKQAGADVRPGREPVSRMQPPAKQLRRGFLDRPRKRLAAIAQDIGVSVGTAAGVPAASAEEEHPAATHDVSAMRLDAVGNGTAALVAGEAAQKLRTVSMPASGPESARRDVFRQLQPLCSALLPLRSEAARLAPALRALHGALRTTDPVGLQARLTLRPSCVNTLATC